MSLLPYAADGILHARIEKAKCYPASALSSLPCQKVKAGKVRFTVSFAGLNARDGELSERLAARLGPTPPEAAETEQGAAEPEQQAKASHSPPYPRDTWWSKMFILLAGGAATRKAKASPPTVGAAKLAPKAEAPPPAVGVAEPV